MTSCDAKPSVWHWKWKFLFWHFSSLAILMFSLNYRGLTAFLKIDIYHDFINN
jgi:hypothetical protein